MLAFLLFAFLGTLVVGDNQIESGFTTIVNPDSGSFSLGLDLEWGSKDSVTSTTLCGPASKTLNPESTSGLALPTTTGGTSHMVEVGAWGDTLFNPNHLNASVGDVIRFRFLKLNHTLTQSTLDHPCTPSGGFDSGFQFFNPLNQTNKTLTFIVQTTDPIWFFCHQNLDRPHCQSGMVFGLNPANKMSQFLANARSIVGTAVDYFPTGSAISYFPTGSSVGFPAPPPGITSVPPGVFYSGYAGMTNRSIGSYRTSPSAIASIASSFTQSGLPAPEVTSDGITTSTTSSAMIPSLRVSFKVLLSLSLVLVLI